MSSVETIDQMTLSESRRLRFLIHYAKMTGSWRLRLYVKGSFWSKARSVLIWYLLMIGDIVGALFAPGVEKSVCYGGMRGLSNPPHSISRSKCPRHLYSSLQKGGSCFWV